MQKIYQLFLFHFIIICIFINRNNAISSVIPISTQSKYFQTGNRALTTSGGSGYSANITFTLTFVQNPQIIQSFHMFNYDLNYMAGGQKEHQLNFILNAQNVNTTSFESTGIINTISRYVQISISFLAIDGSYFLLSNSLIIINPIQFNSNNLNKQITGIKTATAHNLIYIYGLNLVKRDSSPCGSASISLKHQFQITYNITKTFSTATGKYNFQFTAKSYHNLYCNYRILLKILTIQDKPAQWGSTQFIFIYFQATIAGTTPINLPTEYKGYNSLLFYGLRAFSYNVSQSAITPNFNFNYDLVSQYDFQFNQDSLFSFVRSDILIINEKSCNDPIYVFQKFNVSSNQIQCYDSCDTNQFQIINSTQNYCVQCNITAGCKRCKSLTNCLQCLPEYQIDLSGICTLKNIYALNNSVLTLCSNLLSDCIKCSNNLTCIQCTIETNVLNTTSGKCNTCAQKYGTNCIKCDSTYCLQCNSGYFITNGSYCTNNSNGGPGYMPCVQFQCAVCNASHLSYCFYCKDQEVSTVNGYCTNICGDGKIMGSEEFDDNNLSPLDGCSPQCKIQSGFMCQTQLYTPVSKYNKSICYVDGKFVSQIQYTTKLKNMNRIQIKLKLIPKIKYQYWSNINFNLMLNLSGKAIQNTKIYKIYYFELQDNTISMRDTQRLLQQSEQNPRNLYIYLDYMDNIQNQQLIITIDPTNTGLWVLSKCIPYSSSFILNSKNNLILNVYSDQLYQVSLTLGYFGIVLGVLTFLIILCGIFVGYMNIVIQFVGIIQLAYYGLLEIGQLNPMYHSLINLKYSLGYNPSLNQTDPFYDIFNQQIFIGVQMFSSFSNNANLSIFIILLFIVIGLILKLLLKFLKWDEQKAKKIKEYQNKFLGSVPLYLIICFSYLISVSTFINILTQSTNLFGLICMIISLILIIIYIIIFIKLGQQHDIFKSLTFKIKQYKKYYIIQTLLFRSIIGSLLVVTTKINGIFQPIIILVLFIAESLIFLIKYPIYVGIRKGLFIFNKIIILLIPFTYFIIRLHFQIQSESNLSIYLSLSLIIMLYVIFGINFTFYLYSIKQLRLFQLNLKEQKIFKRLYEKKQKRKIINEIKKEENYDKLQTCRQLNNNDKICFISNNKQNNIINYSQIQKPQIHQNKIFKKRLLHELNIQIFQSITSNIQTPQNKYETIINKIQNYNEQIQKQKIKNKIRKQIKQQLQNNILNNKIKNHTSNNNNSINNKKIEEQNIKSYLSNYNKIYNDLDKQQQINQENIQQKQFKYQYTNQKFYNPSDQYDKI